MEMRCVKTLLVDVAPFVYGMHQLFLLVIKFRVGQKRVIFLSFAADTWVDKKSFAA